MVRGEHRRLDRRDRHQHRRQGRTQRPVPVITLQLADGSTRQVWGGAVDLRQQLADIAPQLGTFLRIEFTGELHTGQPSPMKEFTVTTPRVDGDEVFGDEPV